MEDARVVLRGRAERDGERLVRVVVRKVHELRAGKLMLQDERSAVDFGKGLDVGDDEAVYALVKGQFHEMPFGDRG